MGARKKRGTHEDLREPEPKNSGTMPYLKRVQRKGSRKEKPGLKCTFCGDSARILMKELAIFTLAESVCS